MLSSMVSIPRCIGGRLNVFRNVLSTLDRDIVRNCSTSCNIYSDRDPSPIFFSKNVQFILKRVTGLDSSKIFKRRFDERTLRTPKQIFLTDEELQGHMQKAERKAKRLLQMPPVVKERQPIDKVLSHDPALKGYSTCKHVFADITFGVSDRSRIIVVRDGDGTLREASWEERDRVNQVYYPRPGRSLNTPKMFDPENLKSVLARGDYLFVLEMACNQYEPDDPEYQRVTSTVYEAVDATRSYSAIHSTRHYGPLCFYLTWHRKIDSLLVSLVQEERLSDAADIVQLFQVIHKNLQSVAKDSDSDQHLQLLKRYLAEDSLQRSQLQLAVDAFQDLQHQRQQHQQKVSAAHGLQQTQ